MNIFVIVFISILTFIPFVLFVIYIYEKYLKTRKRKNIPKKIFEITSFDGRWEHEEREDVENTILIKNDIGAFVAINAASDWITKFRKIKICIFSYAKFKNITQIDNLKWQCQELYIDKNNNLKYRNSIIIMEADKQRFNVYSKLSKTPDTYTLEN